VIAYAAVTAAFGAGLVGVTYFSSVLGSRIYDAHQRGLDRLHRARSTR
jgi:hypothetical protein